MYSIERIDIENLTEIQNAYRVTAFQTLEWACFLEKNQHAEPVLLKIMCENKTVAFFVGMIVCKMGVKIFGSPFEGWLTPDMGFIVTNEIDYNTALKEVASFAFQKLHCLYVQVMDKKISFDMLDNDIHVEKSRTLYLRGSQNTEEILESFSKNGRRDVRAAGRKGVVIEKVPFDKDFIELYYDQLIDVFAKQNLKPFYSKEKLFDLAKAYENCPDGILALEAFFEDKCIATIFSLGNSEWAYYVGAASYREYQKYLPNEALFWEFIKYWSERGTKNYDLVGYREYKLKYNPDVVEVPVIIFTKYNSLIGLKKLAKIGISSLRKLRGK